MKRETMLLALLSICFAAGGATTKRSEGLQQLCSTTKSTLAMAIFVLLLVSLLPLAAGAFLSFFKKDDRNLRVVGIVLLIIGVLCMVGAIISVIIYLLVPAYVGSMAGNTNVGC